MYHFKVLSLSVRAVQINHLGKVIISSKILYGDAGSWVVINEATNERTTWSDIEFRRNFEPADIFAEEYLKNAIKK